MYIIVKTNWITSEEGKGIVNLIIVKRLQVTLKATSFENTIKEAEDRISSKLC